MWDACHSPENTFVLNSQIKIHIMPRLKKDKEVNLSAKIMDAIIGPQTTRPFKINAATIADGFCHYGFEVTEGVGLGDKHPTVKGAGLYKNDMGNAFGRLHVHLACIDDVFKHAGIEIDNIDKMHIHDLTALYNVTSIKIVGSEENETVIIIGSKHIDCTGGRIAITTPRIPIDGLSSYKWHNELADLVSLIREEVALYKEGKYTLPDDDEDADEPHRKRSQRLKQTTILDNIEGVTISMGISKSEPDAGQSETEQQDDVDHNDISGIDIESSRV